MSRESAKVVDLSLYRAKRKMRELGITPTPFNSPSRELFELIEWCNRAFDELSGMPV